MALEIVIVLVTVVRIIEIIVIVIKSIRYYKGFGCGVRDLNPQNRSQTSKGYSIKRPTLEAKIVIFSSEQGHFGPLASHGGGSEREDLK